MIAHPEPDILECEVKWALGRTNMNKARRGDGIPGELFQIPKDDAVKVLHSIYQQIWTTRQWHRTGKGQFSFQSQRKAVPKNVQTTTQLHSFGIVFLWDWNENRPFPVLWPLLSFPNFLAY